MKLRIVTFNTASFNDGPQWNRPLTDSCVIDVKHLAIRSKCTTDHVLRCHKIYSILASCDADVIVLQESVFSGEVFEEIFGNSGSPGQGIHVSSSFCRTHAGHTHMYVRGEILQLGCAGDDPMAPGRYDFPIVAFRPLGASTNDVAMICGVHLFPHKGNHAARAAQLERIHDAMVSLAAQWGLPLQSTPMFIAGDMNQPDSEFPAPHLMLQDLWVVSHPSVLPGMNPDEAVGPFSDAALTCHGTFGGDNDYNFTSTEAMEAEFAEAYPDRRGKYCPRYDRVYALRNSCRISSCEGRRIADSRDEPHSRFLSDHFGVFVAVETM